MLSYRTRADVLQVLHELVRDDEFARVIARMGLNPRTVVHELARDPAVLARAQQTHEQHDPHDQVMAEHRAQRPRAWERGWRPSRAEVVRLCVAVLCPVGVILFELLIGHTIPEWIGSALWAFVILVAGFLLLSSLPVTVHSRLLWMVEYLRLAVGLRTGRLIHRRELREVLVPAVRGWIGGRLRPEFDTRMVLRDSKGLLLPGGKGPLVRTSAVEACGREINRGMPAAVGIAGIRGTGKSTLVARAVANEFTDTDGKPVLGVLTSAPVRYDPRDFVLHLHASVCRAVLDFLAISDGADSSDTGRAWRRSVNRHLFRADFLRWIRAVLLCGLLLALCAGLARVAWGWHGPYGTGTLGAAANFAAVQWDSDAVLTGMGTWETQAAYCALLSAAAAMWIALSRVALPPLTGFAVRIARATWSGFRPALGPASSALSSVARQHLKRIRFLQTRTSGWSGKTAGVAGIELAATRSTASAEQPLTYPEVVERFRDFLSLAGRVLVDMTRQISTIVIAVDELDKIAEPGEAHAFLNDIKGIFGVPNCVFLISVSEDALTAFERRGMPARDAFDSALTSMIRVEPFSLTESQRWLAYRAIGIPAPFIWFCHCFSGGLPRDLARIAIAMRDLAPTHRHLEELTLAIVRADLAVKRHAFVVEARRLADGENDRHELIELLFAMVDTSVDELGHLSDRVWPEPFAPTDSATARLRSEVACYLTFCATVVQIFTDKMSPAVVEAAEDGRSVIDLLADIRRRMAVSTPLAWRALVDFRTGRWPHGGRA